VHCQRIVQLSAPLLDPTVVTYESGSVEQSHSGYAAEHLGANLAFLKFSRHKMMSRTGDAVGALARIATESRLTAQRAKPAGIISTGIIILRKSPSGWRIVHFQQSDGKFAR
jgi:hypothetical protein